MILDFTWNAKRMQFLIRDCAFVSRQVIFYSLHQLLKAQMRIRGHERYTEARLREDFKTGERESEGLIRARDSFVILARVPLMF